MILVAIGGAVGAVMRHGVSLVVVGWLGRPTPYGTLFVNVVGSFVLGALVTWAARVEAPPDVKLLIGTGLCGALTTFSTFSVESLHLFHQGHRGAALANVLLNVVVGLGAAAAGMAVAGR
ncbi:MAG: fluoride efflux transporter CrcB [Myxococcota bacterium]